MKNAMKAIKTILVLFVFIVIYSNAQQIPNAGFENWTNLKPDDWETNSCPLCDPPFETYIVRQDSDACQGTYSAKFINNNAFFAWAETKFAAAIHPLNLFACVKSNIQNGDSVKIDIIIYDNGRIADEGHWLNKSTISTYTNITIPIGQNSMVVDSIKIKITGGTQINTILNADNLSFASANEIQEYGNDSSWTLSPNPFIDHTWLKFKNLNHEKFVLTIYNTNGQLVKTIDNIYTDRVRIEKDNLANGLYFFKLYNYKMVIASGKLMTE
jgi:hypothetical protein